MGGNFSGILGILALAGVGVLYFFLKQVFPSLAGALLIIGGIIAALIIVLVALVIYFAFRKPKNKTSVPNSELNEALSKGRSNLMELRRLGMRLKNQQLRKLNDDICAVSDKILRALKDHPEDMVGVRRFFNYYLPTLGSILLKYVQLEESGVPAENVTESAISCLGDIKTAMEKQYENLFNNDILDLTVEMEVLTLTCKRDGLLEDEGVRLQDGDRTLTLTL